MTDAKSKESPVSDVQSPPAAPIGGVTQRQKPRALIHRLIWISLLGVAGGVSWLTYTRYFNRASEPVAVAVVPVTRSTVEITVTESGTVELGGQQTLKSPREVTVEQVKVREGDRVRPGQPLLILRDREAQDNLQDQQVENAKLQVDRDRSREKVMETQQRLKTALNRFKASQTVFQQGAISGTELQRYRDEFDQATTEFRDARATQRKAELDVRKGQEKLAGLQQQLRDRVVTAPISGIVLKINVRDGDGTKTESNLLAIGNPNTEVIKLQLTTLNATKVRLNQPARVSIMGPNPKTFTGRVISLSAQATPPNQGEGSNSGAMFGDPSSGQAKVEAKLVLAQPSKTLIPGSLVSVEVITDQRQNVVAIPPEAVQQAGPNPFVWLKDDQSKAKQQPVILGLQGLQQVEITSGLNAGDQLVLAPPNTSLAAGMSLKIGSPPVQMPPQPGMK